jgi:outer membrane protein TolC
MKIKGIILVLALLVSFSTKAQQTQNDTDTLFLSIDEAIKIGLQENLTLKMSEMEIEKKREKIKELQSNMYPQLSASGQYTRNLKNPVIFMPEGIFGPNTGGPLKIGFNNSYNGTVSLSLPLFTLGIYKSIDMSKKDMELSGEKYNGIKQNLIFNIKKAYYNILLTKESYNVIKENYQSALDNYNNIKNLYKQGIVSEYDMIRSKVSVENIKPSVYQLANAYRTTIKLLKVYLNLNENIPLSVKDDLLLKNTDYIMMSNPNDSLQNNTNLKQLDIQMQLIASQIQFAKSERIPNLVAFGNYQYQSQSNDYKFGDYNWIPVSMVGFQLNIPIFSGFSKIKKTNQVQISLEQLKLQKQFTKNNLELALKNALDNMQVAIEKIKTTHENVKLSEKGYLIARTSYSTGQSTLLELNDARVALSRAQLDNIQARFDYLSAKIEYKKIIGTND